MSQDLMPGRILARGVCRHLLTHGFVTVEELVLLFFNPRIFANQLLGDASVLRQDQECIPMQRIYNKE